MAATHGSGAPSHGAVADPTAARIFCAMSPRSYRLIGADGASYTSAAKAALGGHSGTKIYGRLDCPAALRAIARGGPYARYRVFFADEPTAVRAGYRPCAVCMRLRYAEWKKSARR